MHAVALKAIVVAASFGDWPRSLEDAVMSGADVIEHEGVLYRVDTGKAMSVRDLGALVQRAEERG